MPGRFTPPGKRPGAATFTPPKISGTGQSYGPPVPGSEAAKQQIVTDSVTATWWTFVTALGVSAPAHLTRMQRATSALRRYGG